MATIGSSWALDEEIEIPKVLYDTVKAMNGDPGALGSIALETTEGDPSETRDITNPIYKGCWWRGEVPVGSGTPYDELTRLFRVSGLPLLLSQFLYCVFSRISRICPDSRSTKKKQNPYSTMCRCWNSNRLRFSTSCSNCK